MVWGSMPHMDSASELRGLKGFTSFSEGSVYGPNREFIDGARPTATAAKKVTTSFPSNFRFGSFETVVIDLKRP